MLTHPPRSPVNTLGACRSLFLFTKTAPVRISGLSDIMESWGSVLRHALPCWFALALMQMGEKGGGWVGGVLTTCVCERVCKKCRQARAPQLNQFPLFGQSAWNTHGTIGDITNIKI